MKDELIAQVRAFMNAQQAAEMKGQKEFICPLCGGRAAWSRSPHNNHLACGCRNCDFNMIE